MNAEHTDEEPTWSEPIFAILYNDHEHHPEIFCGAGAEEAATMTFNIRRCSWSCYLLSTRTTNITKLTNALEVIKNQNAVMEQQRAEVEKVGQDKDDALDLMRDEFIRIRNLTENTEIQGLCDRAAVKITQNVPVIRQRDNFEKQMEQRVLELANSEKIRHAEKQILINEIEQHTATKQQLAKVQQERDEWREHAAESDHEYCQMSDWLIGNALFEPKTGLINHAKKLKDRIRDLISLEGECGDLKQEIATLKASEAELRKLGLKACELAMHYLSCEVDFTEELAQEVENMRTEIAATQAEPKTS